jgi:predicted GIY-YIG superfamily endonuclease
MAPSKRPRVEGLRFVAGFPMTCFVYILRLRNGRLYVGSTDNLARRWAEHQAGTACRTTAVSAAAEILYSEPQPDRTSAVERERQIKRWSRAKKLALIKGNLADLKELAGCRATRTTN